jgi:hypothetical protein
VARDFPPLNLSLSEKKYGEEYVGKNGSTRRLGRAMTLRSKSNSDFDKTRRALGHLGPYLPILLEACQEQQFSYEYRDGATSYGAYTFCMAKVLRENRKRGINPSFKELSEQVALKLQRLKYNQTPNLIGAKDRIASPVPWAAAQRAPARPAASRTTRTRKAKKARHR